CNSSVSSAGVYMVPAYAVDASTNKGGDVSAPTLTGGTCTKLYDMYSTVGGGLLGFANVPVGSVYRCT
ncbi:MAG: hypothetical protein J0H22_05785, partial [Actinobacteria bacterium]|nr:hypothetical protein [Actinomycetota bacterium]